MNILVVDDNNFIREIVSAMIEESGHSAVVANGHEQALKSLQEKTIDLVLMDVEMPEVDGFQLTEKIRKLYLNWIPIIFLSSNDTEDYLSRGIDVGGDDYLTKPVKQVILNAKIRAMERIVTMKGELDRANKQLELLSNVDPLTQVLNRRGMEEMLAKAWLTNNRLSGDLSILMIDIDYFKSYNDNYGHLKGDECLANVAQVLRSSLNRATDFVARYGGEEFIIALPFTPLEGARFKAKEILKALENRKLDHEYSTVSPYVSVSIGITSSNMGSTTLMDLIEQADQALYLAKDDGRNRYGTYVNL